MREAENDFKRAGLTVRFVVMLAQNEAKRFCARFGDAHLCIADHQKRTYKAMALEQYNLLRSFSDRDLGKRRLQNKAAGFKQDWAATSLINSAQLPGAAFIGASGTVRWIYRGTHPGDLPSMNDMLRIALEIMRKAG